MRFQRIGLVLEGGGGKGSYQIGVWKAIRELGLEKKIVAVSGTSVGALNAALFAKGDFETACQIWREIDTDTILAERGINEKLTSIFSQRNLKSLIDRALQGSRWSPTCKACFVTCRSIERPAIVYYDILSLLDPEYRRDILLASSALPVIFNTVELDNEKFTDGGFLGDNTPLYPLLALDLDLIIVVHLSGERVARTYENERKGQIVHIVPSESLGNLMDGVLDFEPEHAEQRIRLGFCDGMEQLQLAIGCINEWKPQRIQKKQKVHVKGDKKVKTLQFKDDQTEKIYKERVEYLKKLADEPVCNQAYLWDQSVERYAVAMEKVRRIFQSEELKKYVSSKLLKNMDTFLKRCSNAEFHIALVGAIKAGKSTLINALLGYAYASTKVTPETASLTKFRKGNCNYVKVSFYTSQEWNRLWASAKEARAEVFLEEYEELKAETQKSNWLDQPEKTFQCGTKEELVDEISKWTSSQSANHYFVKEVEVGLEDFDLPEGVILVDTPGLDDVVQYRSNITRDYIDRANAVLVCVKADALTGQEMATIHSVFANTRYNPEKVYIVATQIDSLNRPDQHWKEQREEWLKSLKNKGAYGSLELASKNLIGVSAYLYTLLKNYPNMKDGDDEFWDLDSILSKLRKRNVDENYDYLKNFTNIELLKGKIDREIVVNYRQYLIEDIRNSYMFCKEEIQEAVTKIKASQEEIIKASQGSIEEIRKKQEEYSRKCQEAEADKKALETLLKRLRNTTKRRADELEKAIKALGGE